MNKTILTLFVLLTSCYSKPTQSEPIGTVEIIDSEVTVQFVATGE